MEFALSLIVLAAAVAIIAAPPRRARHSEPVPAADVASLKAAKEAKFREIRDAELDLHTSKLSAGDHMVLDHALRAEAIELMRRLDEAGEADERSRPGG